MSTACRTPTTPPKAAALRAIGCRSGCPGRKRSALDLSGAADVSNAHDGWWIQPGLDYKAGSSETVGFSARVFSDYASANYMDEFRKRASASASVTSYSERAGS